MKHRRMVLIGAVVAVVVVMVAAGAVYAYNFASKVNQPHKASGPAIDCGTQVAASGLRSFSIVPAQTTASYKVHENLIIHNQPSTDAVGKTQDVSGTFSIRTNQAPLVAALNVTVNLSTLKTDEAMRDRYVRNNALQTDAYPNATFVSTCTQGMPASYSEGQEITFKMVGNLTMHGKTNQEIFSVVGKLSGDTVTGTATTTLFMTDFGIEPPNLANVAIAEDRTQVTLEFMAKEG
ncbi:MAG: YceI family protein [Ktedonobacteraceae bacterium]|nr:YceI family protein [Ktedonobacteraceae bacterium]